MQHPTDLADTDYHHLQQALRGVTVDPSSLSIEHLQALVARANAANGNRQDVIAQGLQEVYGDGAEEILVRLARTPGAVTPAEADEPLPQEARPAPLGPDAYHGVIGRIVRAIEPMTEADPTAILMQLVVGMGCLLGRTIYWRVGATMHTCLIYLCIVGRTGGARKGTSMGYVRHILAAVEPEWAATNILGGLTSGEGLIELVRDPEGEHQGGLPDKRVLVVEEEMARPMACMGRDGSTLAMTMRSLWDCGTARTLTRTPYGTTDSHPCLIGHITPYELTHTIRASDIASGWGNRILFSSVYRARILPSGGMVPDLSGETQALRDATEWAHGPGQGEMRRDTEAEALWHTIYPDLTGDRPGVYGALTERAAPYAMRIACIYAAMDRSRLIRVEHLRAGLAIVRYGMDSVRVIWGDQTGDDVADRLRAAIEREPGITRAQMSAALGRNVSASRIGAGLAELLRYHLAHYRMGERTRGGRAPQQWYPGSRNELHERDEIPAAKPFSADSGLRISNATESVGMLIRKGETAENGSPPALSSLSSLSCHEQEEVLSW